MADDDIVQKVVIQGEDQASPVFKQVAQNAQASFAQIQQAGKAVAQPIQQGIAQIGTTATQSFGAASAAAQAMQTSVGGLSSVVSKFATAFTTGLAGFAGLFRSSSQAADEHGAALKRTGAAAEEATTHHSHLRGEIRAVGEVLRVSGLGPLTEYTGALGGVALHLGPVAATLTAVAAALKLVGEAALHSVEAFRALREVSEISGIPVEELSKLQQALALGGMSAAQFGVVFGNLFKQIAEQAPAMATAIEQSAIKTIQAQQKVAQSALAVNQAQLAGRQTSLQIAQLQQQLTYLPQIQALESKRADLAVADAEARVQQLRIQKQLREGTIDEEEAQEKLEQIAADAAQRELEKAELEAESARLQKQMLPEQQALQERQMELQLQSLQLQQRANVLSEERARTELRLAEILAKVAQANDLAAVIEQMKRVKEGTEVAFNPLTTAETKAKALIAVLGQLEGIKVPLAFADMIKNLDALSRRQIADVFKLKPEDIEALKEGSQHLEHLAASIKAIDVHAVSELSEQMTKLSGSVSNMVQQAGSLAAANLAEKLKAITDALTPQNVQTAADWFKTISEGIDNINQKTSALPGGLLGNIFGVTGAFTSDAFAAAKRLFTEEIPALYDALTASSKQAGDDSGKALAGGFTAAQDPIKGVIDNIIGWLGQLSQAATNVGNQLQGLQPNATGTPQGRATGGLISGGGGIDTIPIMATAGEFVMRVDAVRRYGPEFMHAINQMRLASVPRYASGGLIGAAPIPSLSSAMASGPGSGQRVLTLNIEGRSFTGMNVPENVAQQLERFAIHSQIASAGRKQSWRK